MQIKCKKTIEYFFDVWYDEEKKENCKMITLNILPYCVMAVFGVVFIVLAVVVALKALLRP